MNKMVRARFRGRLFPKMFASNYSYGKLKPMDREMKDLMGTVVSKVMQLSISFSNQYMEDGIGNVRNVEIVEDKLYASLETSIGELNFVSCFKDNHIWFELEIVSEEYVESLIYTWTVDEHRIEFQYSYDDENPSCVWKSESDYPYRDILLCDLQEKTFFTNWQCLEHGKRGICVKDLEFFANILENFIDDLEEDILGNRNS